MTRVIVLGTGPAGFLAAHGALQADPDAHILFLSDRVPERTMERHGVTVMHELPLGIEGIPQRRVLLTKVGSQAAYAEGLYGSPDAPCSWQRWEPGERTMYDAGAVYSSLLAGFDSSEMWTYDYEREAAFKQVQYQQLAVGPLELEGLLSMTDVLISTIPSPMLCRNPEVCEHFRVSTWHYSGPPSDQTMAVPENTIAYLGLPSSPVYRLSNLFGVESAEAHAPVPGFTEGYKPTGTTCRCPELAAVAQAERSAVRFRRAGRFGTWRSGVLLHDAYQTGYRAMTNNDTIER